MKYNCDIKFVGKIIKGINLSILKLLEYVNDNADLNTYEES